jgi:hypothetical protein
MKKIVFTATLLLAAALSTRAQDIITTKNGEDIQAKVLEVAPDVVKYKKFSNPDGPTFSLYKSEILMVRYENGDKDIFNETSPLIASGPVHEGMKYREYKDLYDPGFYVRQPGDPYSRGWAGVASFLIPGLGEAIDGEWVRAAQFFGVNVLLGVIQLADTATYRTNNTIRIETGTVGTIAGVTRFAVNIWSIFDAVRIAKVKNMYYQDLRSMRSSIDMRMEPYFACTPVSTDGTLLPVAGVSMKLAF